MKKHFALWFALLLLLTACTPQDTPAEPSVQTESAEVSSNVEPEPSERDDFGLSYLPAQGLNPYTCTATVNRALFSLLYEGLFAVTNQFRAEPVLCESFWVTDGGTVYTFSLLPGVTFSDGTPLTAADVTASIEAARTSEIYKARLSHISNYLANEDGTFSVYLDTPYENFALMLDIPIVKADTVSSATPVGTGSYYFSDEALVRNPHWRQTVPPVLNEDSIPLTPCERAVELRDNFEFGDTDLVYCDPNSAAAVGYRCDYEAWEAPSTVLHYIGFNLSRGYFTNDTLRTAVTYAIDRETLSNTVYGGFAQASPLPCSPNSDLYDRSLAEAYAYAPERFSAAVRDSGVMTSENYAGYTGIFLVCSEDPTRVAAAEYIAEVFRQAGLNLQVNALSREAYQTALRDGNYDLYYGEVRLTSNFDLAEFFKNDGVLAYGNIADTSLLSLCTAALENSGSYLELCSHVMQQAPICPVLFKSYAVYVTRGMISNITPCVDLVFHSDGNNRTLSDADQTYTEPEPTDTETDATDTETDATDTETDATDTISEPTEETLT